jgi:hypothetical protein
VRNPEVIPLVVFIFVVIVMAAAVLFGAHKQHRRQVLERVAHRFHGRFVPADLLNYPQVRLRFQSYPALLKYVKVGKQVHTQFTITWPDPDVRCEIYPQDIFSGFRKLLGMVDIEIGSPQFDAAFFIEGNHPEEVRQLLSADVQAHIFHLASLSSANFFATHDIQVKWSSGALTVTKPSLLSTYEALEQFVSLSGELFVAAMQTRYSGIEFVAETREPDTVESQCQVCGEPLTSQLVYCRSCQTPHHHECWEYFGGCSTYACGHKQFVTQLRAKPPPPKAMRT